MCAPPSFVIGNTTNTACEGILVTSTLNWLSQLLFHPLAQNIPDNRYNLPKEKSSLSRSIKRVH